MRVNSRENAVVKSPEKLLCESCGAEFSCGANTGECWCFDIEVKSETLEELRENFERCLCEDCLKSSAAKNSFTFR